MGRRKRRKSRALLRPRKVIPKIFLCPRCGQKTVKVWVVNDKETKEKRVIVKCGSCLLEASFQYIEIFQPVDYYHKFIDMYYEGKLS